MRGNFNKYCLSLLSAAVVVLTLLVPPSLHAQAISNLNGRVVDQQGAILPGVSVKLKGQETGLYRDTISNENGAFAFPGMTPGLYQIEAELPGFKKYQRSNITLEIAKTVVLDVTLEVGSVAEEVQVTADAPLVDTTSNEVGGTMSSTDMAELPSINRNFNSYMSLLPGAIPSNPAGNFGADNVSLGGQAASQTLYMLDGASDNDDARGGGSGPQARVPLEAIQEFQVLIGQYDAEYGGSGGVLNAVSKQGTNSIHGTAFTLIQDSRLAKEGYFVKLNNLAKPVADNHQFGGTLGGPVVHNKAFYFGSLERVIIHNGVTFAPATRPDLNTTFSAPAWVWNVLTRFDHQINSKNTWNFVWLSEWSPQILYGSGATAIATQTEQDHDRNYIFTLNSSLTPSTLHSMKISAIQEDYTDASAAFTSNGRNQSILKPTLAFQNFTDQQHNGASNPSNHTYTLNDSLSWFVPDMAGSHSFKAGFVGSYVDLSSENQGNLNGQFSFSSSNAVFDPLNPRTYPDRFSIRVPDKAAFTNYREAYWGAFMQDKWKVNQHLTLNLGLRYDREVISISEAYNPAFAPGKYPIDKNNFAPRLGFAYALGDHGKTAIHGGWGLFFQRTTIGTVSPYASSGVYADSFTATFPANNIDPGPSKGQFPTDPMLAYVITHGLVVDRATLSKQYPVTAVQLNTGTVRLDNPDRKDPWNQQVSFGVQQQLAKSVAVKVDYSGTFSRDFLVLKDMNPGTRVDTSRTGTIVRPNPNFVGSVQTPFNLGYTNYNQLAIELDKRFSNKYSFRASYTLAKGLGNVNDNNGSVNSQVGNDLHLENNIGPTSNDRRHNLAMSGTMDVPHTGGMHVALTSRFLTGSAMTLTDSSFDLDRNGLSNEYLAAGTYTGVDPVHNLGITVNNPKAGRGTVYGPKRFQLDGRFGYKFKLGESKTLEAYSELLNITRYTSFSNPGQDRRTPATFLVLTGTNSLPPQIQFGAHFSF